jgi:hypothetical protein
MPIEGFETLLEKCRQVMRLKHRRYRTEEPCLLTIRRFIGFHGGRTHPKHMGRLLGIIRHRPTDQPSPALLRANQNFP